MIDDNEKEHLEQVRERCCIKLQLATAHGRGAAVYTLQRPQRQHFEINTRVVEPIPVLEMRWYGLV